MKWMDWTRFAHMRAARIVAAAAAALACAVVAVGVWEYRAGRNQLLDLLRDHAATLQRTIGAAAQVNRTAAERAETDLGQRLLDNARMLAELDRVGRLDPARLDGILREHHLFRITLYGPDGLATRTIRNPLSPAGPRGGPDGATMPAWIRSATEHETVTAVHRSRRGDARLAVAVRRPAGGAVVVAADAKAIEEFQRPYSLDTLLSEIQRSSHLVAFIALDHGADRIRRGVAADEPVLEIAAPVDLGGSAPALLTLGMRLDEVREAERRMALRLAASLSGVLVLSVAALGFVWLRHEYGDLSARHARAQEALRYRERQAAIGTLAATVAHEIRNPLNGIAISVQRLRREFPCGPDHPDASWRELTDVLESETRRLDGRVQQFLEFARPPQPVLRPARASTVTADVVAAMRPFAERRQVRLHSNLDTTGVATLDADQLRQALENIVRNAIEASRAGSAVRVACRQTPRETRIDVADEGAGIPVEQLPRIFDLYFTTKTDGSGIGLAIARQIVAAHGGTIDVASEPGVGTRMTIHLPRHEQADAGTDAVDR